MSREITYGCCEHCDEDKIHDFEKDWHTVPCNAVHYPQRCNDGGRPFVRTEDAS